LRKWAFLVLAVACLSCRTANAGTNIYRIDRLFTNLEINVGAATVYNIVKGANNLTNIVGIFSILTDSASATEYEGVSWGQESFAKAWSNVLADTYPTSIASYPHVFDDPGWIKGTRSAHGTYGGYMWILQNSLSFNSSGISAYTNNGHVYLIDKVLVGTLGDFDPNTITNLTFPLMNDPDMNYPSYTHLTNSQPVEGSPQAVKYSFDTTAYYRVLVPETEITEVKGLYKEDGSYVSGYTSSDNVGRVYCNHVFDTNNPGELIWTNDQQYIELTVSVKPDSIDWPSDARVVWEFEDPDDRSDTGMCSNSAVYVDTNDYDSVDGDGDGYDRDGDDNTGTNDAALTWEEVDSAYALSNTNETAISNGISKVRFHVTDDGGDNFIVKAKAKVAPGAIPMGGAKTGRITVWKKIQCEYRQMISTNTLPVDQVQIQYDRAFVEFDFQNEGSSTSYEYVAPTPGSIAYCGEWTSPSSTGQFHHRGDGGWHFVCAARKYSTKYDANPYGNQESGTGTVISATILEDPTASFAPNAYASHSLIINSGQTNSFSFTVEANTTNALEIKNFEYKKPDGTGKRELWLDSAELNLGSNVTYAIRELGVTGYAPDLDANVLVFVETWQHILSNWEDPPSLDSRTIGTLVHELMHSFALFHNCGNTDTSGGYSCVGSWSSAPVFYPDGTYEKLDRSLELCGEHIRAIRQSDGYGGQ